METVKDSHGIIYKRLDNGTCYHVDTPNEVVNILEWARQSDVRLHFRYGDSETGRDWGDEYMIEGYIGRSTGGIKIPLLVHNSRSLGGCALLDHCIVKISMARGGEVLYLHPKYKDFIIEITPSDLPEYTHNVIINGELHARCHSEKEAIRVKKWMLK